MDEDNKQDSSKLRIRTFPPPKKSIVEGTYAVVYLTELLGRLGLQTCQREPNRVLKLVGRKFGVSLTAAKDYASRQIDYANQKTK